MVGEEAGCEESQPVSKDTGSNMEHALLKVATFRDRQSAQQTQRCREPENITVIDDNCGSNRINNTIHCYGEQQ